MCGICGKISLNIQNNIDVKLIRAMAGVLIHRGPDDGGVYVSSAKGVKVGLGHRRLSIIDLSSAGRQPMSNEDKSLWLVCNGEIYNFQELREGLIEKGHRFYSHSDNEVILHLYEEEGVDCVNKLRGMFAFALWDENKQRLLLARDRVGKKPLNYAFGNGSLIFASEIKSILQDPDISRRVNIQALDLYLTYQYVPPPETIFGGINKLPPAHILVWENGNIRIRRYWNLSYKNKIKLDSRQCAERLLDLLTEAIKLRMTSDVSLGVFLSGGVDSSAVVAIMSKLSSQRVKTFSIGFKEQPFNELEYAKTIARLFNTEHHEYIVEADCIKLLPKLVWHFNEPFADSSAIATYCLSKMARQEVTVALNGDGGDESFAGYDRYVAGKLADTYSTLPYFIRKNIISPLVRNFPESTDKKDFLKRLKRFIYADGFSREKKYIYWMSIFDQGLKDKLYSGELKNKINEFSADNYLQDAYLKSDADNFLDATLGVDVATYLPGDLLVKVDITSMANSLEARSPFLDHKIMEFAASLPANLKLKGLTSKYILKKALERILPERILNRGKYGFGVPVGAWLRSDLRKYAYDLLLSPSCTQRGYFAPEAIRRLLDEHCSKKADHGPRIWSLINLELWHQMFID